MKRLLYTFIVSSLMFFGCMKENGPDSETTVNRIKIGDRLPAGVTLTDGQGTVVFSSGEWDGKKCVVFLFQSDCEDCRKVFPEINDLYGLIAEREDITLTAFARDSKRSTVESYFNSRGYNIPFIMDPARKVYNLFANNTVPRIYIAGSDGVVRYMWIEKLDADSGQMLSLIEKLE